MIGAFDAIVAAHRGEVTAQVTSAHPLTAEQVKALTANLKTRVGRNVTVATTVDPAILGGLVVQLGSQLIDGSIRTRLNSFAQDWQRTRLYSSHYYASRLPSYA